MNDPYIDLKQHYAEYSVLPKEIGSRLLERLEHRRTEPQRIICVGGGDSQAPAALKRKFRKAKVVVLDSSPTLLGLARKKSTLLRPFYSVCASLDSLPFADRSVDLVYANLAGHWRFDGARVMAAYRRVLKPNGMLLFSSLGTGSYSSLDVAQNDGWIEAGFGPFEDILKAGDQMMAAGFREPVMDSDRITLTYPDFAALCEELEGCGAVFDAPGWFEWKQHLLAEPGLIEQITETGRIPVRVEVIYGTAFAPEDGQPMRSGGEELATFSVESLTKTLRK